ncbi:phospholipase/carboxylesterase [Deinococcus reticulitermitis]|uniref:Phospholipase/carboxylesterase n=1 Tax=Deinococcus reticulitermitis TaxID=856736 RepID=A0A1H7BVT5_9DEIO|nr:serine esterase [Deinococcus reticulitermitis]SEJ81336.1 phospholipase/carboxylesterase [Deinococcus reticulitermitis]
MTAPADHPARLRARPDPSAACPPPEVRGLIPLNLGGARDGLLYVPQRHPLEGPRPLIVACHGAGSEASHSVRPFVNAAEERGLLLLACDSRAGTWDMIRGGYGPDVAFIDRALSLVFSHYAVDPARLVLDGFSDGASYALSLGLGNGDLFSHLMAFSPGFLAPAAQLGRPRVFVSHGTADRVLPIERCGRVVARELRAAGYDLHYTEFEGGHTVPPGVQREALEWLGA